jgi:transposase
VRAHPDRLPRLEQDRHEHVHVGRVAPVGEALQARRGGPCTVALPLGAALGDRTRCASPRARRQGRGLMPAAPAAGEPRRPGSMTTAGPTPARRVLGKGAWAARSPAQGSRPLPLRLDQQPHILQASRWKAQVRLCQRYRRLGARGQPAPGVTGAIARAWSGVIGAMAQEVPFVASNESGS